MKRILTNLLRTPPLRFQISGVRFIERHNGRCVVGDDMGLGKTYQALAYMALHPEMRPVVIVCPETAKYVWKSQLRQHAGIRSSVLHGQKATRNLARDVWILNFDIAHHWADTLKKMRPKLLIVDEAHRIKNLKAKRTRACQSLGRKCEHVLGLDGTPIRNRPIEFFPILNLTAPGLFPSVVDYAFRYCDRKKGFRNRGWDDSGASNLEELHELVSQVMIRRTKTEVMPDLPKKTRSVIPIEVDNWVEYRRAEQDFIRWYRGNKGSDAARRARRGLAFVKMQALLQLAALGKLHHTVGWIREWLEDTGEKIVVFTTHNEMISRLHQAFPNAAVIHGGVKQDMRAREVNRFQNDSACRVFLGNLQAAGESITLHAASTVLFAELGWSPGEHDQAEDRVLRIGQTATHMNAYYLVGVGTVEEKVIEVVNHKRKVVDTVVDGQERDDVRTIVLERLVRDE